MDNQPTPLTEDQLTAIEARVTAATPGPWRNHDTHLGQYGYTATVLSGEGNDTDLRAWLPTMSQTPWDEARNVWADAVFVAAARADVPALLAEVRRLRAELATALRPNTPRLCACGHSNHAHTVPAPHSCFAFGKTCPCRSFQQLPHDEAVAQLARNVEAAEQRSAAGEQPAAEACGKCRHPFDPADKRFDGRARYRLTPYCRSCVDRCHDTEIADHRCVICA